MANIIKIRRGTTAALGMLDEGVIAFSTDDKTILVGTDNGNVVVKADVDLSEYIKATEADGKYITTETLDTRLDGMTIKVLSSDEYNNLTEEEKKDTHKLYILNDVEDTVIDLSGFATKEELAKKVDAAADSRLMTNAEGEKVANTYKAIGEIGKTLDILSTESTAKAVDIGIDGDVVKLKNAAGEFIGTGITIDDLRTALSVPNSPQ